MVASDVHGKNHHVAGTFGEHVRALRMRVGDGRVLEIDEASEPELFRATLGGMGLTGHILEVEVQLERIPSFWIWGRSERARDLDELIALLQTASATLAVRGGLGRHHRARRVARARRRHERALCRADRGTRRAAAPARAPRGAVRSARLARRPLERPAVQLPVLPRAPRARRPDRPSAAVLLSARRGAELEPPLRAPRHGPVPVRGSRAAATAESSGACSKS